MRRERWSILIVALLCLASGCDPEVRLGSACAYDSECPSELVCRAARCRAQCLADRDCPATDTCIAGGCVGRDEHVDAGLALDAGDPPLDASPFDAALHDASAPDAGAADAAAPDAGPSCTTCVRDVSAGHRHTCAVLLDGRVACWGANDAGQLGDETTIDRASPVIVAGITNAEEVATGHERSCARLATGEVRCWGRNAIGSGSQLGDGTVLDRLAPVRVLLASDTATAIASGFWHSCATLSDRVQCWGQNQSFELGDGTNQARLTPVDASGADASSAVAAGDGPSCAIESGTVRCWGYDAHGETGTGDAAPTTPTVLSFGAGAMHFDFLAVDCGGVNDYGTGTEHAAHCCAIREAGDTYCWGRNDEGQLGLANRTNQPTAQSLGAIDARIVDAGGRHTCTIDSTGGLRCWGSNTYGQLGADPLVLADRITVPTTPLDLGAPVLEVSAGSDHTCAILETRELVCWGLDVDGQLGDGTRGAPRHVPRPIAPVE